jgi:hypothetical protein
MGKSVLCMSMSLDGFVAGPNETPENGLGDGGDRLHEWILSGAETAHGGVPGRPDGVDGEIMDELMATGAVVAGRGTVDPAGWWNQHPHQRRRRTVAAGHRPQRRRRGDHPRQGGRRRPRRPRPRRRLRPSRTRGRSPRRGPAPPRPHPPRRRPPPLRRHRPRPPQVRAPSRGRGRRRHPPPLSGSSVATLTHYPGGPPSPNRRAPCLIRCDDVE